MPIATHIAKFTRNVTCNTCHTPAAFKQGSEYEAAQSVRGIIVEGVPCPAMNVRHSIPSNNPSYNPTTCATNFQSIENVLFIGNYLHIGNEPIANLTQKS